MKRTYKGFTLIELLIVITIIGLLGTMMLISGTDAQNAAKVTKITEGFKNLSAAIIMYNDAEPANAAAAIADTSSGAATIITGAKKYIKNEDVFGAADATAGTYYVEISGSTVWLKYTLPAATGAINTLLKDKAKDYGLKKAADADPKLADNDYDGAAAIYVNVF
ncbi:MAG: prepilin-type N-terminal cleavage/methylation domain-containing protein [Synergistaceae bacterium]|nr:prepilin-type N-terminal cleavage/methylation domain-containing protein [Synergistaceae bacterium]